MYFSLKEIQVRGICGFFLSSQYCFAALPTDFDSDSDLEACQLRNESVHWSCYIYSLLSMIRFMLSRMSKAVERSAQFCLLPCCIQPLSMSALHIVLPAEVRHVSQRRTIRPGDLEWDLSQRPQSHQVHNQRTYELNDRNIPLNIASCDWPSPH